MDAAAVQAALFVARVLLALIFGIAAVAKLVDRDGSRHAMIDFGVPARIAPVVVLVLPVAELVVAAALIASGTALWGAIGAVVLMLAFIAGVGANMALGRKPDCHCFGQLSSGSVGCTTI